MPRKTSSRHRTRRHRHRGGNIATNAAAVGGNEHTPTQLGGARHRRRRNSKKGGSIIATAAVPFGLLALQRYFKGSRSTKKNVRGLGNSLKRTFRRRR